jgi:nucleoside-diphosphate-sugar epimerase
MAEGDKILITGGAGYLGSVMAPLFLHSGHSVTVLDNFMYTQTGLAGVCHHPRFDVVEGDAREKETLEPLLKNADIVIPLAALVGAPICNKHPEDATSTNLGAVRMLVEMLSPDQRVLLPNTNSGYGIGESGEMCTLNTPTRSVSVWRPCSACRPGPVSTFWSTTSFIRPSPRASWCCSKAISSATTSMFATWRGHSCTRLRISKP